MSQEHVPPLPKSSSGINGCLIGCLIVFVVGVLGVALVGYMVYRGGVQVLDSITEPEPRELPALDVSDEERAAANEKMERFQAATEGASEEKEFSFTGDEINVMLRSNPKSAALGESVYVSVANGELRGEVSLNLGEFMPILEGRYANGSATFEIYAQNDRLFVFVENFQIKGEDAQADFVQQMRTHNLAQDFNNDPKLQEWMSKIEIIEVVDDRVVVTLK